MKQLGLNKIKGFTLVELMVVVAIIAILSVIGLTLFTSAQANARDARRKADIDAIANAIEVNRSPGTVYYTSLPATTGFSGGSVPTDNNNSATASNYCIMTSTATAPSLPTAWSQTSPCPAAPVANAASATGQSNWTTIPAAGLASQATLATTPFYTSTINWIVCARLETSAFYCKPSAQ